MGLMSVMECQEVKEFEIEVKNLQMIQTHLFRIQSKLHFLLLRKQITKFNESKKNEIESEIWKRRIKWKMK